MIKNDCAFGSKQDLKIKGHDGVQWKLELEVSVVQSHIEFAIFTKVNQDLFPFFNIIPWLTL